MEGILNKDLFYNGFFKFNFIFYISFLTLSVLFTQTAFIKHLISVVYKVPHIICITFTRFCPLNESLESCVGRVGRGVYEEKL